MIAFACSITKPDQFRRCAEPGIRRAAEADSARFELPAAGPIARSYNALLDRAAERDDLEALVLLHQDAEIVDADLCAKVRAALSDPDVAVVGCAGALDVRSIAWWEGSVTLASFINRYEDHGGGDLLSFSWTWEDAPPWAQTGGVETLDGFVLALAPWAVRSIRFDESLSRFHGYDLDYCLQVREAGHKVVTADLRTTHHRTLELLPDAEVWIEGHIKLADHWDGRWPGRSGEAVDWKRRARRAEAEREAARTMAYSNALKVDAEVLALERAMSEMTESLSWRATAPLRRLNRMRRRGP